MSNGLIKGGHICAGRADGDLGSEEGGLAGENRLTV